jgi:hypothetical protein
MRFAMHFVMSCALRFAIMRCVLCYVLVQCVCNALCYVL